MTSDDAGAADTRWLVDGMNVIGSRPDGWWKDRRAAITSLVADLDELHRRSGQPIVVVFDGEAPAGGPDTDVEVVFVPGRGPGLADDEIVRLVSTDPRPGTIKVVTSDRALAQRVTRAGAQVAGAGPFRRRLDDVRSQ